MDAFVPKMKKKYIDRLINREKQWPPCHSNKLVKLQLVEREKGEGYCANIQRGREDKTVKRTSLAYDDLFKVERGKKPVRKVLVEGGAGIGKTTLSISLSEDWAREKLFQEFELLLLLPLRHKKVASAGSLPELLKLLHPSSDVCKAVASYVENEEEKVLIIADGWDELSDSDQQEGSFLYELLFETFPLMSVVVTSRPSASAPLHRLPCIDRFVEISGFSKEDIKEYIESEFTSDQEKASRLLEQLEDNPLVESVCSIPLNCSIMCHLWRTLEEGLPSTMTQLYTKIILNVILRNMQKKDAFKNILSLSNFNALPKDLQQSFKLLCEFAFKSLDKNQIVLSQEELVEFFPVGLALDEKILCFGLLQSTETVLETGHGVSFHFIHLTFMEYLAALHLVEQPQCTQLQVFSKKDNDPHATSRFTMVWRFFFGIRYNVFLSKVVAGDNTVNHILRYVDKASFPYSLLSLCHCAFEAQNNLITNEVIQFKFRLNFLFNYFGRVHTAHDCAALLYIIAHMEERSGMNIDLSNCGVRDNQIRTLTDILASKQGKLQVEMLNLSGNKLTGKCVSGLFHRVSPSYQSDTKLEPKSDAQTVAKSVSSRCGLSELGMSELDSSPGACGLQILVNAIRGNLLSRLKNLILAGSLTSDADTNGKWLTTLIDDLSTYCPDLDILDVSQNNLGVAGASAVARGLSKLQHHSDGYWLYLDETNIGDDGLKVFVNNINCVCNFQYLFLSGNDIHAAGVSYLADAVCSGKIVICGSALDLHNNPLGLEGVTAVVRMLSSNHCQACRVDLSRCKLTSRGDLTNTNFLKVGQQLCLLPYNCTVESLHLDGNSFTGEGIHILAGLMYLCNSLDHLSCSDCGITSDDLILLLDKLTQLKSSYPSLCSKLHTWDLDNNAIDDRGVSYLISHLLTLFPSMGSIMFQGFSVDSNKVSKEMETRLEEELRKLEDLRVQEELRRQVEFQSCPSDHSSSSEDGSYIESQSVGEEASMSHLSSSSDDGSSVGVYPEGEEEPNLSTPHPPPTPVTDQQESCSDDESLDLRPPALNKPKHEDPVEPPSSESVYATGESPTSSQPLEDNDRVNQTGCSVGSVHFDTPTSQPLCGVTQASPLTTAPDIQFEEQRSCDPSHDSCDNDEFFTPPPSPPPPQDDDIVIVNEVSPSLTEDDLASVQRAVWEGRAKWYNIGLEFGLTPGTLDAIQLANQCDPDRCFTATLKTWLRSGDLHPSWSGLARSLRAPPVGLESLAEQLPNLDLST